MFKLGLKNYRCFIDDEFNFSRINILIGENSAGKSSILKFLLALRQSFRSPNQRDYNLTFSGTDTDLGNYKEAIHNHEINRNLGFSFEFQSDFFDFFLGHMAPIVVDEDDENKDKVTKSKKRRKDVIRYLGGKISSPTLIEFEITKDLSKHTNIKTKIFNSSIGEVEIIHPKDTENNAEKDIYFVDERPKCEIHFHSKHFDKTFIFTDIEFEKEAFLSIIIGESLSEKIEEQSEEETEKIYLQIGFLLLAQNYVSRQIAGIEYINPLMSKPAERIYLERDRKTSRRISDVKDLIDYLETNPAKIEFKEKLSKILSEFGIADDFHLQKEGVTKELRIVLNDINNNITDVGFGVSLQIPIFAQALISEDTLMMNRDQTDFIEGQTLLIEQPEVHLHPRLQAKFIDILLRIGNNNIYFIETHSEHIIRMLQILIKEKKYDLKPEDISIHYLRKEENKIIKSEHKIEISGKLKPKIPKGFNDVSYDLAFKLMD